MLEQLTLTHNQDGDFYAFENDLYITSALKDGKRWEPHVLDFIGKHTASDSVMLDAGAHIGTHTVSFARQARNGMVYAFEPMPAIFRVLELNISLNRLTNVKAFATALSNQKNSIKLPINLDYVPKDKDGKSNLGGVRIDVFPSNSIEEIDVEVTTIDSLGLKRLDILKLDVETYEKQVILGGKNTIEALKPLIVFEAHSAEILEDISGTLRSMGYNDISSVDPYYKMDFYARVST